MELQEAQANTFVLYASMPYFMLEQFDLSDSNIVYTLSETFTVTESLVMRRLEQIKNRILIYRESKELYVSESRNIYTC